ncbi:hypothetical protein PBI_SCTP2_436 [Salicola phage SCTP-2]|nr:hypothetical protein PBI_SCTP2_436 [Salicola phage SCTP-2]
MPSKQKSKGSSLERDIAKDLTQRYGETFVRTIGSGAFVGGANAYRKDTLTETQTRSHKGDVTPPDVFGFMNMECKFYKEFNFHQLFSNACPLLDTWIEQCLEPADKNDINIIVIKINRKGKYICVENNPKYDVTRGLKYKGWVFFDYDIFFEDNNESFKQLCHDGK